MVITELCKLLHLLWQFSGDDKSLMSLNMFGLGPLRVHDSDDFLLLISEWTLWLINIFNTYEYVSAAWV